jgi:hypothetical protein
MDTPQYPPARRAADLAAAAWLELGLEALQRGNIPAAVGALACIDDDAWAAFLRRFPNLPNLIEKWSNPR